MDFLKKAFNTMTNYTQEVTELQSKLSDLSDEELLAIMRGDNTKKKMAAMKLLGERGYVNKGGKWERA
jgi:hypothetical protein